MTEPLPIPRKIWPRTLWRKPLIMSQLSHFCKVRGHWPTHTPFGQQPYGPPSDSFSSSGGRCDVVKAARPGLDQLAQLIEQLGGNGQADRKEASPPLPFGAAARRRRSHGLAGWSRLVSNLARSGVHERLEELNQGKEFVYRLPFPSDLACFKDVSPDSVHIVVA